MSLANQYVNLKFRVINNNLLVEVKSMSYYLCHRVFTIYMCDGEVSSAYTDQNLVFWLTADSTNDGQWRTRIFQGLMYFLNIQQILLQFFVILFYSFNLLFRF